MFPILIRINLAVAVIEGRRQFQSFEKTIMLPAAPFPGLHIFLGAAADGGDIVAGVGEMGIESRIIWNTLTGQYVIENTDFRTDQATLILTALNSWGFTPV